MKKRDKISIGICGISVLLIFGITFCLFIPAEAVSEEVDQYIGFVMDTIDENALTNTQLAASSNPYDYIQNNDNFNAIVELGTDALPEIADEISDSDEDGLKEYFLAVAAEKIAKVDNYGWSTGKGWQKKWCEHLSTVESEVDTIINSDESDNNKIAGLEALGTPAVPFIVDAINDGQTELIPAADYLLNGIGTEYNGDLNEWINANSAQIAKLRNIVADQK